MRATILLLAPLILSPASRLGAQQPAALDVVRSTVFDSSLHIALESARRLDSGVYVLELSEGAGAQISTAKPLTMQIAVWLPSGKLLQPTTAARDYLLGSGDLIQGFEKGVVGMKVGGKRRLLIPPALGYGDQDRGAIPANSVLIMDVTVVGQP